MSADARPFGLILAGGAARRIGGGDKPLLPLGGRPMIDTVVGRLCGQCGALAINAAGDPARWSAQRLPVIADPTERRDGPLAGVLAGLRHIESGRQARWLLTVPGDTPFIPPDLVARLMMAREGGRSIACASSGGRVHPTVALWDVDLRAALEEALHRRGLHGVRAFQAEHPTGVVDWPDAPVDPFFNVNTPADLAIAEGIALGLGPVPPGRVGPA